MYQAGIKAVGSIHHSPTHITSIQYFQGANVGLLGLFHCLRSRNKKSIKLYEAFPDCFGCVIWRAYCMQTSGNSHNYSSLMCQMMTSDHSQYKGCANICEYLMRSLHEFLTELRRSISIIACDNCMQVTR